jgi:dephospho-CoA kinase
MRVIGLTGGIASGKSTVGRMLRELGAEVVDADQVAREVVEPGRPAFDDVVRTFGREVLDADGRIDRKKLGAIVFGDAPEAKEARRALNAITHPRIAAATAEKLAGLAQAGAKVAFYEAALLVENGVHKGLGGLIVVAADEAKQVARVVSRDGLSEAEARARIAAQMPLAEKVAAATWVVDTNGTLDQTRAQVQRLWKELSA